MLLVNLQKQLEQLSKSERRIAEVILAAPDAAVHATTGEIARQAGVSDPMVSRLCKTMGCKGFPEFKVQLAQSLASESTFASQAITLRDDTATYINKMISAHQAALEYLKNELNDADIERAVAMLDDAKRIEIFGIGGCSSVAQDAQHKLFRLGVPTIAYEDSLKQRMVAAAADSETLILLVSFTGRTRSMVDVAKVAKSSGARLLGICAKESPLARECDLVINSGSDFEDTTVYVPMQARIMILAIIDILTTGVALRRGPEVDQSLVRMKEVLEETKIS